MDRKAQLKICKQCILRHFDPKEGILCSVTNAKPDFATICDKFTPKDNSSNPYIEEVNLKVNYSFMDENLFTQTSSGYIQKYFIETNEQPDKTESKIPNRSFLFLATISVFGLLFIRLISFLSVSNFSGTLSAIALYTMLIPFAIVWIARKRNELHPKDAGSQIISYLIVLAFTTILYFIYVEIALWHVYFIYFEGIILPFVGTIGGIPIIFLARRLMLKKKTK